jgi:hypothetical protein
LVCKGLNRRLLNHPGYNSDGALQGGSIFWGEGVDEICQGPDAAVAAGDEQAAAFHGGCYTDGAAIVLVLGLCDEAFFFKRVYDARHGGRADLFCVGEIAEGERSAEDENGES